MVMEYAVSVCQVSRMKVKKFQDTAAQSIRFGVEVETMIPRTAQVADGGYHHGEPHIVGYTPSGQ